MADEYLTTAELSEKIRKPVETLRAWRHTGHGPTSFKLGRGVLYATSDVEAWIAEQRQATSRGGDAA